MTGIEETPVPLAASIAEARAYLRHSGSEDEALIAAALRSATQMCERFTGQALVTRAVSEVMAASPQWRRLGRTPVRAITLVEALAADGSGLALPIDAYAVDIDGGCDGWVQVRSAGGASRVRISYTAGLAGDVGRVPEPLRHGIVQLAGHLLRERDAAGAEPPATVVALWRPWRRMRIGAGGSMAR